MNFGWKESDFDGRETFSGGNDTRDVRRERLQIASAALGVASVFLISLAVQFVLVLIFQAVYPEAPGEPWYVWVLSMLPMYGVAMPLSLLFFRLGKADAPEKKRIDALNLAALFFFCFGMTYVGNLIGSLVNAWLSRILGTPIINDLENLTTNSPFWLNLVFCGILAPVLEEIFYRKLVIDRLRRYGELPAMLISGITFGLIHGNFSQFFYAAMLGVVFGYIYLKTGKLRYSIGIHMAINLIGGVFSAELVKRLADILRDGAASIANILSVPVFGALYLGYVGFIVLCFVLLIPSALVLIFRFRSPLRRAEPPMTAKMWVKAGLLNPAVWLLAAVIVLLFL